MNIPAVFVALYVIGLLVTLVGGWVYGYTRGDAARSVEGIDLDALDQPRHAADAHHHVPSPAVGGRIAGPVDLQIEDGSYVISHDALKRAGLTHLHRLNSPERSDVGTGEETT